LSDFYGIFVLLETKMNTLEFTNLRDWWCCRCVRGTWRVMKFYFIVSVYFLWN